MDTRRCASKDARPRRGGLGGGPTSIGEGNKCQRGVPARMLGSEGGGWGEVPHQLQKGTSASKDTGPRRGWIGGGGGPTSIGEGNSASEDAGPLRGWIVRSHIGWRGEPNILYKGVKTSP